MSKKYITLILFGIVILASILRIYKLGEVPPSPDWDEAALGYNAYSIMQTGKDEYGKFMPVVLRSFDDYKPALYTYFVIPFIGLFNLNIISVRLPSVIFGILTVFASYFLVKEIFEVDKLSQVSKRINADYIALLTSFLLAISPWHIQFSRIAFESNVGLAFNVFAALFFLKGLKNPKLLIFSVIFGIASVYVYQSEKVFTPLLFLSLILIFWKKLFNIPKKHLVLSAVLGLILISPMLMYMASNKESLARARGVSIFSDQTPFLKENVERLSFDKTNKDYLGLILDNRRVVYAKAIASGYLSHFNFNWLFIRGDIVRHHAPSMGLMYLFELPFLLIGIYFLTFSSGFFDLNRKTKFFILFWFLITPIPASITSGVPHAIRTLNFLPTTQIITAVGILGFILSISKIKYQISKIQIKYLIFIVCFLFLLFNISYYLDQYFVQQNYFSSEGWQYGYKEVVSEVEKIGAKYDKVIVVNKPYMDQSYMFFLFYLKYPPDIYQKEAKEAAGGFKENHKYGKFEFRPIDWNREEKNSKILFIGMPDDFQVGAKVVKTFNFLDGKPAIVIVEG